MKLSTETLNRYYAGQDSGAGSNYMGMCAAVLAVSHVSVDCRACSGKGYRELTEAELTKWAASIAEQKTVEHRDQVRRALSQASDCQACRGSGKVTARRGDHAASMDSMWTTVRCGRCRGGGEATTPTDASAERQDVCLDCGGAAYIVPVTVRAKASNGQSGAGGASALDGDSAPLFLPAVLPETTSEHDPDHQERRRVARDLEALGTSDPQLAAALASYHGPEGDRWVEHRWGRGFVAWQHTQAGKQLAEHVATQSTHRAGYLIPITDRLAQIREAHEHPGAAPKPSAAHQLERVLLGRADREAREILRRLKSLVHPLENVA